MDIEVACGSQACARAYWVEEGETSSPSFFVSMTAALYHVLKTCAVIFLPFMHPCLLLKLPVLV